MVTIVEFSSLAKVGAQQFSSQVAAEEHARQLGNQAVVVKDENDQFWAGAPADLSKLTAKTMAPEATNPTHGIAPEQKTGARGFQVVGNTPVAPTEPPDSAREQSVAVGERFLGSYIRQSELFLNAVYADEYSEWSDTFGNTQRIRPADAATVMLRLNASVFSVVSDLRSGAVSPEELGLPKDAAWEDIDRPVSAKAIYDLGVRRLHADAIDYDDAIPEMLADPIWEQQPIVINDPNKGTYPLSPDEVSLLHRVYTLIAPNEAAEYAETLPLVRTISTQAIAEAEAEPDNAAAIADANLVHIAHGFSNGNGITANNTQAALAMSVAAKIPMVTQELAEPGVKNTDLMAMQRTGDITGFQEVNGTFIIHHPKSIETLAREVRAKIDNGELDHLGDLALQELEELTGPDDSPGTELAENIKKEGRSRSIRTFSNEIIDIALIGLVSGGVASFAQGLAVAARATPGVIRAAHFLANSATFTTLSGINQGQVDLERYPIDAVMFGALGMAGRYARLAGKLVPGNTAAMRFVQGAAARTATVGTSAAVLTGFGVLESAVRGTPLSKKEVWEQFCHSLMVSGTLHAVNSGIAKVTPQLAAGAPVRHEIARLQNRWNQDHQRLTRSLDSLSLTLVDASKTPKGSPKLKQLAQRADQQLTRIATEQKTLQRNLADGVEFAKRSLPPEQAKLFVREMQAAQEALGIATQVAGDRAAIKAAVTHKTSTGRQAQRLERAANRMTRTPTDAAPLADFFDLKGKDAKVIGDRDQRIQQQAQRAKSFNAAFEKSNTVEQLRAFANKHVNSPLTLGQRAQVFRAFMDKGEFGDAQRFYERSAQVDRSFARAQVPWELYIVTLNKTGQVAKSITESQRYIRQFTRGRGKQLDLNSIREDSPAVRKGALNGEVLGGLGKALKLASQQASKGELTPELETIIRQAANIPSSKTLSQAELSKVALKLSTRYYEAGFVADMEYYPGINAVYNNLALGNSTRAERLAKLVTVSTRMEGGLRSTDYWALATQLEAALIGRDHNGIATTFRKTLQQSKVGWEMGSTANNLEMVAAMRTRAGEKPGPINIVAQKLRSLSKIDSGGKAPSKEWIDAAVRELTQAAGPAAERPIADLSPATTALLNNSFHFRGINSHFVDGNVAFGGAVPDIPVNRNDVHLAREALKRLQLTRVTDFDTFDKRVSPFLDKTYGLVNSAGKRPLEGLHSSEHTFLDNFRNNLLRTTRARETGDSRTNLMAEMAMGAGDCRQVGFSKQLLFDVWKADNQRHLMRTAFDALKTSDTKGYSASLRQAAKLEGIQLVTFTNLISAPVEGKMYKTKTDAQGRPVPTRDGAFQPVENHTLNALLTTNSDGNVTRMQWRDSFYRSLYKFGNLDANPADVLKPDGFSAGVMGVQNANGKDIPVRMKPTKYSGAQHQAVQDEAGQFRVGGQEVAVPRQEVIFGQNSDLRQVVTYISTTPATARVHARQGRRVKEDSQVEQGGQDYSSLFGSVSSSSP